MTSETSPTIAEVLEEFLDDQCERLSDGTFRRYEDVVDLLQDSLDGYAYQYLDAADRKLFDKRFDAEGEQQREFCEVFGPEHILPNVDEFLNYFMVRKVMAGKDLLRAAGTVTKKLARWLAEKGYADAEDAEEVVGRGAAAARDLPQAEELAAFLYDFAQEQERDELVREVEGHFSLARVERGRVWLENSLSGREYGPIAVPEEISRRCKLGWRISGAVGLEGKRWQIVDVWNVYT